LTDDELATQHINISSLGHVFIVVDMPGVHRIDWKGMLVAGACAAVFSVFNPFAGLVPVVALQQTAVPPQVKEKPPEVSQKIENLVRGLGDPKRQRTAARQLEALGDAAVPALANAVKSDKNRIVRARAAETLGRIGSSAAVDSLAKLLEIDKAPEAVVHLVHAISGTFGDIAVGALVRPPREAFIPLIRILKYDKELNSRQYAAETLGNMANNEMLTITQLRAAKLGVAELIKIAEKSDYSFGISMTGWAYVSDSDRTILDSVLDEINDALRKMLKAPLKRNPPDDIVLPYP
jgi:hypothetical protein